MENIKLYENMKEAMASVIEAENNANAWRVEARNRMKDVNILIAAEKKINKDTEINPKEIIAKIREELAPEVEDEETEETEGDETADVEG